jgi:uncharacterized membrane-anchored protein YhcB (DUF1043 family)
MLMSVIGWVVLGLSCWIAVGMVAGLFVGKVIHRCGKSVASTFHRQERESRSDVAAQSVAFRARHEATRRLGHRWSTTAAPIWN